MHVVPGVYFIFLLFFPNIVNQNKIKLIIIFCHLSDYHKIKSHIEFYLAYLLNEKNKPKEFAPKLNLSLIHI